MSACQGVGDGEIRDPADAAREAGGVVDSPVEASSHGCRDGDEKVAIAGLGLPSNDLIDDGAQVFAEVLGEAAPCAEFHFQDGITEQPFVWPEANGAGPWESPAAAG